MSSHATDLAVYAKSSSNLLPPDHNRLFIFVLVFVSFCVVFGYRLQLVIRQEADEHIYKFVLTKFGFSEYFR